MKIYTGRFAAILLSLFFLTATAVFAQTTAFNFQGRLNDGSAGANGNFDLQFKLFDALAGGNQVGATVERPNLTLVNGVFSTTLDFGAAAFTGGDRFLEIAVRLFSSPNPHVILGARQQILSVPFAVRATNSENATNAQNAINSQNSVNATNATNSQNAVNATTAQNSLALGGAAASEYPRLNILNTGDFRISGDFRVSGNIRQNLRSYGAMKAMLYVKPNPNANPTVVRCYNVITNSSAPPCGFTVTREAQGVYRIYLFFPADDHLISVSAE